MSFRHDGSLAPGETPSRIVVRALDDDNNVVHMTRLRHGFSPERLIRNAGYCTVGLLGHSMGESFAQDVSAAQLPVETTGLHTNAASGTSSASCTESFSISPDDIVLDYRIEPTVRSVHGVMGANSSGSLSARGQGDDAPRRIPDVVRQRVAAYAVVTSESGVLLTSLSAQTGRTGLWILPGGGVDAGEHPQAAVIREAWEEGGQHIVDPVLIDVSSSHRVGPGRGGYEDFHAVRLIFRARCEKPTKPVVHDVGGSTGKAAWVNAQAARDGLMPRGEEIAPWSLEAIGQVIAPDF